MKNRKIPTPKDKNVQFTQFTTMVYFIRLPLIVAEIDAKFWKELEKTGTLP